MTRAEIIVMAMAASGGVLAFLNWISYLVGYKEGMDELFRGMVTRKIWLRIVLIGLQTFFFYIVGFWVVLEIY